MMRGSLAPEKFRKIDIKEVLMSQMECLNGDWRQACDLWLNLFKCR